MDEKPTIRTEIDCTRDRVFQLRLMLEQAKRLDPVHVKAIHSRLRNEVKRLNSLVAVRSRRKRRRLLG
jgi:hypothetical protein